MPGRPPSMGVVFKGSEKSSARLMLAGAGVFVVSLLIGTGLGWTSLGSNDGVSTGIKVWIAGLTIGLLLFLAGLGVGLAKAQGIGASKDAVEVADTRIVAVTALNPQMYPIWNEEAYDPSEIKRYVHLRFPDGHVSELMIDREMLEFVGEGMKGTATIVGNRLVAFQATGI